MMYLVVAASWIAFSPAIVAVALELSQYDPNDNLHERIWTHDALSVPRYVFWLIVLISLYAILTMLFGKKTRADHANDIARLIYDGSVLYATGFAEREGFDMPFIGIPYFGLVIGYVLVYSSVFVFAEKEVVEVTNRRALELWPYLSLMVIPIAFVLAYMCMLAFRISPAYFSLYVFLIVVTPVAHVVVYSLLGCKLFHVHHWYWAILCAHACHFDTNASRVCRAAFIAVYVHGVSAFGAQNVYENELL